MNITISVTGSARSFTTGPPSPPLSSAPLPVTVRLAAIAAIAAAVGVPASILALGVSSLTLTSTIGSCSELTVSQACVSAGPSSQDSA